jgi:ankyrin repeat protein
LGALAVFTVQLIHWVNVGNIAKTATRLDTGHAKALAEGITKDLNIRKPVILLKSEMATVSMAWGLRHPSVILPAGSAEWSDGKLAAVLRHELSHIKRHDNMVHLLAVVACAFYWLNPLVWISLRKLHFEREVACDDSVLNSGTLSSAYARYLMEVTMSLSKTTNQMLVPAAMADSSDVKRRLLSILNADTNRRPMARGCAALCILASLCLAAPVAGFRLSVDDSAAAREESEVTGRDELVDRDEAPTTLHNAATYGHTHFAEMLLEDGADLKARDGAQQTPLHKAAIYGHARIARLLLDAGADVDGRDREGQTPLHDAAVYGYFDVAGLLLDKGAEVNARDRAGAIALHEAAIYGHARVARMLIAEGAEVRAKDGGGRTPLHEAAVYGHFDVAVLLLDEGAEVNARDSEGQIALHEAAIYGHARVARMLLDEGANIDSRDDQGYTPLHKADVYGHQDVCEILRAHGAK